MFSIVRSRVIRVITDSRLKSSVPSGSSGSAGGEIVSGFAMYASIFCVSGIAYMAVKDSQSIPPLYHPNAPTQSAQLERTN
ncbi:hypothetical protein TrLO_g9284 [Triparma laevis f. longispina]|uniref:Uncharacterized protein n=1 Tax=Triparma laevis f. longispina TaxID=1714387 RepID=A0A9W7FQZ2_9STRA|nr:hypothetical protein TrLO_g9284 [Triparma laevis f. longispina]